MVMDALTVQLTDGRQTYDDGGRLAASGRINPTLLQHLLQDPYLRKKPPKTTGREYYGKKYVAELAAFAADRKISLLDCLATAARFTAESIAVGIREFASEKPDYLIVGGGEAGILCFFHI